MSVCGGIIPFSPTRAGTKIFGLEIILGVPGANLESFISFGLRVWPLCLDSHTNIYID